MMNKIAFVIALQIVIGHLNPAAAQHSRMKKKETDAKGTVFAYWGYNRSAYTKSDIQFVGPGYDFTLAGASAHDNQAKFSAKEYFGIQNITVPQFNLRAGYYFKDHWSISLGYDHMKYLFDDKNEVFLSGEIDPGVDNVTNWSGTYNAVPVTTDYNSFHYENSDGLNFIRVELSRTDRWLRYGSKDQFVISTDVGISAGGVLSYNDFNFAGEFTRRTISLSGFGMAVHVAPRFEFFRHVFLQPTLAAGFMNQVKVQTRPNNSSSYAKHAFGYSQFYGVLGFFFYIRSKNGCDSCPVW